MMFTITISSDRGPVHTIKVPYDENPIRWLGELLMEFVRLEQRFAVAGAHPLCGRDQLNLGIVHGGDYPNRLPTPITLTGTLRWTPGKSSSRMRADLQETCDRLAARSHLHFRIDIAEDGCREPFETPRTHPIVVALQRSAERVSGRTAEVIGMALSGDANLFAHESGVPAVYYGPAHETAHSDDERVSVAQLHHCAAVYALTAMSFCGIAG
jgi:acetylornithine deacetylase/succinyl-diaminopimelate desuccinylase-like protein